MKIQILIKNKTIPTSIIYTENGSSEQFDISKKTNTYPKKEKTRNITYRLPAKIVKELETETVQKNISQNILVK